jgi:hypothetical protein
LFAAELSIHFGVMRKKLEVDFALKIPSLPFLGAGRFSALVLANLRD